MRKLAFCFALVVAGNAMAASDMLTSNWLASRNAPPCPFKTGVRTSRSDLVQFGDITASISAQSAHEEGGNCDRNAAVWVTKGGVSQQFDLPDAATNTFSIVDFTPDGAAILLYKDKADALAEDTVPQVALLSLQSGAAPKWESVGQLAGLKGCAALIEPQGFISLRQMVLKVGPPVWSAKKLPPCVDKPKLLSVDLITKKVLEIPPTTEIKRNGRSVAGPLLSCESDPEVVAACYRMRGRVALAADGFSMRLWQVGTGKTVDLGEGMLPEELSAQVSSITRVYANMLVCPLSPGPRGRPTVCIESAGNYRSEAVIAKPGKAPAKTSIPKGTKDDSGGESLR